MGESAGSGDFKIDGDVDHADAAILIAVCLREPEMRIEPPCTVVDFDHNDLGDLEDIAEFWSRFSAE